MLQIWYRTHCNVKRRRFIITKNGGRRHLEFRKTVAISSFLDQFSPKLVGMLRIWQGIQLLCQNAHSKKLRVAAAAILNCEKLSPCLHYWTNPHQIWRKSCKFDLERNCRSRKHTLTKILEGGCRYVELRKFVAISLLLYRSSRNLMGILWVRYRTQLSCRKCTCTEVQDGGCRQLEFR